MYTSTTLGEEPGGLAPDPGEQIILGQHHAWLMHQLPQQLAFPAAQGHRTRPCVGLPAQHIEFQPAAPEHRRARARRGAQPGLHPRYQLADVERLGHIVVGPQAEAGHLRLRICQARQHQDRLTGPTLHYLSKYAEPVLARHQQVQDHQIVGARKSHRHRLPAIGGRIGEDPVVTEYPHQNRADPLLVVHD